MPMRISMTSDKKIKILTINPGSTSTKIAYFESCTEVISKTMTHSTEELKIYNKVIDQKYFRTSCVLDFVETNNIKLNDLDGVIGRGGLLKPIPGGVYIVNEAMLRDLASGEYGEHPSNLGGIIANEIAGKAGSRAYIVDPVVVDELDDIARLSGVPELPRISIFHALNQKSVAKEVAKMLNKKYQDCNFIVAHLGGGISIGAHKKGRVVDVNNALNGDGPFSPERAGGVPCYKLAELCFSGKYTLPEIKKKLTGSGGLVAYKGTNNFQELLKMMEQGDHEAKLIVEAMIYQVSKEIAMHGATLKGDVDSIILTGGLANSSFLTDKISERVSFLSEVKIVPGEREMHSLAAGFMGVVNGLETEKTYS